VDIKKRQLWSREQEVVLETLALAVARPGARFLEVGSWCGDSAVVLARVAQRVGGTLICVDWWRGNVGTELNDIAGKVDVFHVFWNRICHEGLEEAVMPVRGRSQQAVHALQSAAFDMVFLDGDHRYSAVSRDIREYSRLIRAHGILCGHDCEGRIHDYDRQFLERGREIDCHESVHCGVVLAVGETFPEFALDHGIWSVIRAQDRSWQQTRITYPGISSFSQGPVPPIASTRDWQLFRHGRSVYAVPRHMIEADVRLPETRHDPRVLRAAQVAGLQAQVGEPIAEVQAPIDDATIQPLQCECAEWYDAGAQQAARIAELQAEVARSVARCADLEVDIATRQDEIARLSAEVGRLSSTADVIGTSLARAESALVRAEAELGRVTQELSYARIDLELRGLGVADAGWTSVG
jgi:hypothetical protein